MKDPKKLLKKELACIVSHICKILWSDPGDEWGPHTLKDIVRVLASHDLAPDEPAEPPSRPEEWSWSRIFERAKALLENWKAHKDDPAVTEWIESRPPEIRKMVESHPDHLIYRVKKGAPYSGTHPGSIGAVLAYTEGTEGRPGWSSIKFGMLRAAEGEVYLPIYAHVDPEWLEPISLEELERNAKMESN